MKPIERYTLIGIIVFLAFAWLFKGCNTEYKDKIVFVDSSENKQLRKELAIERDRNDRNASLNLKMRDSLDYFRKSLKSAKNKFYPKYREIIKDSLITDSNCLLTLEYANQTMLQYDSLLGVTSRSLDSCFKFSEEQSRTIKFLTEFTAIAEKKEDMLIKENKSFKHLFWRLFWKRK